jgi:hypothetical protein
MEANCWEKILNLRMRDGWDGERERGRNYAIKSFTVFRLHQMLLG